MTSRLRGVLEQGAQRGRGAHHVEKLFSREHQQQARRARADGDPWSSTDAFLDVVGRYREVGIEEFILDHPRDDQLDVLETVAADVLPRLRAEAARDLPA